MQVEGMNIGNVWRREGRGHRRGHSCRGSRDEDVCAGWDRRAGPSLGAAIVAPFMPARLLGAWLGRGGGVSWAIGWRGCGRAGWAWWCRATVVTAVVWCPGRRYFASVSNKTRTRFPWGGTAGGDSRGAADYMVPRQGMGGGHVPGSWCILPTVSVLPAGGMRAGGSLIPGYWSIPPSGLDSGGRGVMGEESAVQVKGRRDDARV